VIVQTFFLTTYVLVWPLIVAAVLVVLSRAFLREWREARRTGEDLV
jgi:hypothetical protein